MFPKKIMSKNKNNEIMFGEEDAEIINAIVEANNVITEKEISLKNEFLKLITGLALSFISIPFILYVWYDINEFNTFLCVSWALSIIWIIAFTYANVFHKRKNK